MVNKPLLKPIETFDATIGCYLEYTWDSIYNIEGYSIKFYSRNNVSTPIGTYTQSNFMGFKISISSDQLSSSNITLSNHETYYATISIIYNNGQLTPDSNRVLFRCEKKPVFRITSPLTSSVIESSTFPINILYAQDDAVMLDDYVIRVYQDGNEVYNSGTLYGSSLQFSSSSDYAYYVNIPYTFDTLSDGVTYTIKAECSLGADSVITNGMKVNTENEIIVSIEIPKSNYQYANLKIENDYCQGIVKISSDVKIVTGIGYYYGNITDDITYIDNDSVDLTEHGKSVKFIEGFDFDGDFTLFFKGSDFGENQLVLSLSDESQTLSIRYCVPQKFEISTNGKYFEKVSDSSRKACFCLTVVGNENYTCCSDYFDILGQGESIIVTLKKDKNLYALYTNMSVTEGL